MSLPARERGLKPSSSSLLTKALVAPRAGAWIETYGTTQKYDNTGSLPARERGLKPLSFASLNLQARSLPARERGLKLLC